MLATEGEKGNRDEAIELLYDIKNSIVTLIGRYTFVL